MPIIDINESVVYSRVLTKLNMKESCAQIMHICNHMDATALTDCDWIHYDNPKVKIFDRCRVRGYNIRLGSFMANIKRIPTYIINTHLIPELMPITFEDNVYVFDYMDGDHVSLMIWFSNKNDEITFKLAVE